MFRTKNHILSNLSRGELAELGSRMKLIDLSGGEIIYEPGSVIRSVYFPETCTVSLVQSYAEGESVEAATVGCEGMIGARVAISRAERAATRHRIQIGGKARLMNRSDFLQALDTLPALSEQVMRFAVGFLDTALLSIACNRVHRVEQRLARWLLMMHDRSQSDTLPLTHDMLSEMLGVQRPTVTQALKEFRELDLVSTRPARIRIEDRRRLEAIACDCYRIGARLLPAGC